ncbi:hypothetical protein E5K00_18465 [Hymenobacter aquaticus]|uniref:DUF5723 domain-containing protein n=1 Tax=Hymenobacter aquaticus TaxID=1867101 RepID=A0A4Z0Q0F6_9BACT|nr:DUF5723 family protein [Hymenobacter aquaticus]TGE22232.1 hypothetical protein E5K00_18465 [Hymenobacter aquaticus]
MKNLRFALSAGLWLAAATGLRAQSELTSFSIVGRGGVANTFANDYQALGVNPANLARTGNATVAFTIGEGGVGVASESLTRTQIRTFLRTADQPLTSADKRDLARAFTSANALQLNADFTPVAISASFPILGSFAFSNRQRVVAHMALNQNAAEILFLGQDAPIYANYNPATSPLLTEALAGTQVQGTWYNEFNFAFARRLITLPLFRLSGGVGYRYIQGVGVVDVRIEPGQLEAYSAMSPIFKLDYSKLVNNPSFDLRERANGLQPVGKGNGVDLGVALEAGKMLRLGLSVTDIGKMTWEGNLLTASDQKLKKLQSSGIDNADFISAAARIFASGTDSVLTYKPSLTRTAQLPTKLRAGAGLRISNSLELGLDVTLPLNEVAGNITAPFVGAGIDYKPVRFLRLSSGVAGGAGYGFALPLGVAFTTSLYEFGVSTRDLPGLLSAEKPYASVAAGFVRFRFGEIKD